MRKIHLMPGRRKIMKVELAGLTAAALILILSCGSGNSSPEKPKISPPPVAEKEVKIKTMNTISLQFAEYRGDPAALASNVDRYLESARQEPLADTPIALVVPHAGYVYSGPVAAYAYNSIKGKNYDTVVVIGPSHRIPFNGISVMDAERFDTPLGSIPMDTGLIGELLGSSRDITYQAEAHEQEHSVEVQLPFLQRSLKGFSLVMAIMGGWSAEAEKSFIDTLAKAAKSRKILLVASSDLSHYHDYGTAKKLDGIALDLIQKMDNDGLLLSSRQGRCELCGLLPVHLAIGLALKTDYHNVKLLHAASSGDTAGPKNQVVGYAAMAFLPGKKEDEMSNDKEKEKETGLGPEEKKRLLEIARQTICEYVKHRKNPDIQENNPRLLDRNGAFVTIKRNGQLRGCIGNFVSREALFKTIMSMAVAASSKDPRFPPMNASELEDMDLEISVLSPMRRISDVNEIEVGRHGLYIIKGYHSGTLLPQVASEYGWDRMTFLQQTCRKAGLPADAWKEGAEIYTYEADVFGE